MRRILIALAAMLAFTGAAIAQDNTGPQVTADHPLYGAKMAAESGVEHMAPNASAGVEARLDHAGTRANETEALADRNETDLANETANRYAEKMREVNDLGQNISDLAQQREFDELVAKATMHHAAVLGTVYERVPEQAKQAIGNALNQSVKGHEQAMKRMQQRGQSTAGMGNISSRIPDGVRDRAGVDAMRAQAGGPDSAAGAGSAPTGGPADTPSGGPGNAPN